MNVFSALGECVSFAHRTTVACVTMPLRLAKSAGIRPHVIHVNIGLVSAGTRLTEVAHYCAHELRKAYLAAPRSGKIHLKLRLRDEDILWKYPVSDQDRRKVERKLVQAIHNKIDTKLYCIDSEINDNTIEITFAPVEPSESEPTI